MYNPGFGDCFLLTFRAGDGSARYMLIDCGVHHQYQTEEIPDRKKRMQLLAEDIAKATANHLHVVVITHEHTDHLYGFNYGRDIFDGIDIDDLWLAWTEDPTDPTAKQLKRLYGLRIRALTAAVNQLGLANKPLAGTLRRVLDFESPDALAATQGKAAQLDYLRTKSRKKLQKTEDYRHPGEAPLTLPGVKGVKVYVLGPPKDTDLIKSLKKESELYRKLTAMNEIAAFTAAAPAAAGTDSLEDEDFRRSRPFDRSLEIAKDNAGSHSEYGRFFQEHYGFQEQKEHGPEWRRIETDWLGAAEQLALDINNYTNNTSLVLAIELTQVQPHKVLLFAADAQVGNWLSWRELSWPGEGEGGETVNVKYLLRHTALYKAGHHGSRNATLSKNGLEMMYSTDLVVMLPVDEDWACNKMGWEHPAEKLLDRLNEKARGRIIRTDEIPSSGKPPEKPAEATESEWQAFIAQLDWDRSQNKLWIQYTLPG
jgi:hypothetical protein